MGVEPPVEEAEPAESEEHESRDKMMLLPEWAYAFARLAWVLFPGLAPDLKRRVDSFVDLVVKPSLELVLDSLPTTINIELLSRRVQAVTDAHSDVLRK
eukprot:5833500-Prymnesium_polylepis.1